MNQNDRKEFEIVHLKIDELKKDIVEPEVIKIKVYNNK